MDDSIINAKQDIARLNEINVEDLINYISTKISNGVSYIDCIVSYSEEFKIDIEVVGEVVRDSPVLMAAVHEEAESLNLVEKINRLPLEIFY